MPWNPLVEADVLSEFNPKEQAQLAKIQGADNLPPILARAINAARASILAGGGQLDAAGTVPDQLAMDVIAIARWKWILSLPDVNDSIQSPQREKDYTAAMNRMDDVAAGKIKVEPPAVAIASVAPTNAVVLPRAGRHVNVHGFERMGGS